MAWIKFLKRPSDFETLDEGIRTAAEYMNLRLNVREVTDQKERYEHTEYQLKGAFLPFMKIFLDKEKQGETSTIKVEHGIRDRQFSTVKEAAKFYAAMDGYLL